jgi:hypothetical protein
MVKKNPRVDPQVFIPPSAALLPAQKSRLKEKLGRSCTEAGEAAQGGEKTPLPLTVVLASADGTCTHVCTRPCADLLNTLQAHSQMLLP